MKRPETDDRPAEPQLEAAWQEEQAAHAAASAAAWRATRAALLTPSAYLVQVGEGVVWACKLTAIYYAVASVLLLVLAATASAPTSQSDVDVVHLVATIAMMLWLPFGALELCRSPFVDAWQSTYAAERAARGEPQ